MTEAMRTQNGYYEYDNGFPRDWFSDGFSSYVPPNQSHFSTSTERRTYGRDQDGEFVVTIDRNPDTPVEPVRPVTPVGPNDPPHFAIESTPRPRYNAIEYSPGGYQHDRYYNDGRLALTYRHPTEYDDRRQSSLSRPHQRTHTDRHGGRAHDERTHRVQLASRPRSVSYSGGMDYLRSSQQPQPNYSTAQRKVRSHERTPRAVYYEDELAAIFFNPIYRD